MRKAVELVAELANFDEKYPNGSLEDFCRYYLMHQIKKRVTTSVTSSLAPPPTTDFGLMRLINRIVKLHSIYAVKATEGTGISSSHEFSLLNAIDCSNEPRKTEAIYNAVFDLSTGIDMVNRLKKIGYIVEYDDEEDRRSKRIKLTTKGHKALATCRKRMEQLAEMEFYDLTEDEKKICILLLRGVDAKFSIRWQSDKTKKFDEIYEGLIVESGNKGKATRDTKLKTY